MRNDLKMVPVEERGSIGIGGLGMNECVSSLRFRCFLGYFMHDDGKWYGMPVNNFIQDYKSS